MTLDELIAAAQPFLANEKMDSPVVGASRLMRKFNIGWVRSQELIGELQHAKVLGQANSEAKYPIL